MDKNQKKLLKQLEELYGSKFEIIYEGAREGFSNYFSRLDLEGVGSLLSETNYYDGVSKDYYLKLISKTFNYLKSKNITSLEATPGICNGCINGCKGFTFIDKKTGVYVDIIIEVENSEIINFMECYDLKNNSKKLKKKERIVIKPFIAKKRF